MKRYCENTLSVFLNKSTHDDNTFLSIDRYYVSNQSFTA